MNTYTLHILYNYRNYMSYCQVQINPIQVYFEFFLKSVTTLNWDCKKCKI